MTREHQGAATASQVRQQIDTGRTGDKTPELDPAAAPLGTDAEAGGAPPGETETAAAASLERRPLSAPPNAQTPELSPDGAMKPAVSHGAAWLIALAIGLAILGLGLAFT